MHIVIRHGERVLHALPLPSGARLLVGRQPEGNDIVLPDPKASRRHGTLTLQGNHIHFTDHGSGNGTFIASKRIPPDTPTAIAPGTCIQIGDHSLTIEEGDVPYDASDKGDTTLLPPPVVPEGHVGCLQGLGGLLRGRTFSLGSQEVLIGRLPECHIQVVDGLVSRRNARITFMDGLHVIEDLDSSNGTFVNKERIHTPRPLRPGDEVCVGEQLFAFRHIPAADAPPPSRPKDTPTILEARAVPAALSSSTDTLPGRRTLSTRERLIVLALTILGVFLWRMTRPPETSPAPDGQERTSHPVTLIRPLRLDIPVTIEATGNLHPAHSTTILLPPGQRVQTLWAEDQQRLREGDRILTMEMTESLRTARTQVTAAVQSAKAEIAKAEAEVGKAESALDLANKNLALAEENLMRNATLYEGGHLLQQEWDNIRNTHNNAVTEVTIREMERRQALSMVEQTRAQAEQAQADLEDVQARIADLEVEAKSAGILDGLKVNPGDTVTPETRVLRVLEYESEIKTIVPVPEDDIPLIRRGMAAEVWLSRAPERIFRGEVTSIPATATHRRYDVEIRVPNEDAHLRPGAQAMVRFHIETRAGALCLPPSVVSQDAHGSHRIFVFDASTSTVRAVPIRRGAETVHAGRRMVEIRPVPDAARVLAEGDHVVFDGHRNLQDGSAVDVRGDAPPGSP